MKIDKGTVVHFNYTLKNDSGDVIDASGDGPPLAYLHGHGNIVPGLEGALEGREVGDSFDITVPAAEGYGDRRADAVFQIPLDRLPEGIEPKVGLKLTAQTPDGGAFQFELTEIGAEAVTADANHPLAGFDLHFSVSVVEIRSATAEELEHGHVHGDGGHQH